jgi:hypothetical protein
MSSKYLSEVLIIALSFVLCGFGDAQTDFKLPGPSGGEVAGVIVGAAAVVVVVAVVVVHYSKKRVVSGCVRAGANGMTLTEEKGGQIYLLSGNVAGIKPGDRMKLQGNKTKRGVPDKTLGWKTKKVIDDFGVCRS